MAEVDPGMDQAVPQQPPLPGMAQQNGSARGEHEGEDAGDDLDPKALKAELDKVKRQLGTTINDLAKHKKVLKRQEDVDALAARAKEWIDLQEESGLGPAQLREQLKAREEHELGEAKSKGDVEKLIANRDTHWTKVVGKKDEEIKARAATEEKLRATIHEITVDRELREEIAKVVEPAFVNAVFALLRGKAKGVEDPDAPYGVRPAMVVGDDDMPIKDFMKQWAEAEPDAQAFLIGNRSQGGGAPPGGRTGGPRMQRSKLTPKQKSDYMGQYGVEAYNKLPW